MKLGYVVLYVNNPDESFHFWTSKIGMVEKGRKEAGPFSIVKVGFIDQEFSFQY